MKFVLRNKIGVILPVLFFLIFSSPSNVYSQMKGDVLLVEKPFHFKIYDKYKQSLSDNQKLQFLPFTPMLIDEIDKSQPLNPLRKVIIDNTPYYLGITSGKQIIGYNEAGKKIFLHRWGKSNKLQFLSLSRTHEFTTPLGKTEKLKKRTMIKLLFYKKNKYLIRLKNKNELGFIYLSKSELNTLLKVKRTNKKLNEETINKIESEVKGYNKKMSNLINTFNNKYHQNKTAPFFKEVPYNKGLKFLLVNADFEGYEKSISALKKKLEIFLIGTEFKIRRERNYLTVTR